MVSQILHAKVKLKHYLRKRQSQVISGQGEKEYIVGQVLCIYGEIHCCRTGRYFHQESGLLPLH